MELNHHLLHVGQVSSPLDHGIVLSVTEVGIEPTESRGSRPRRFSCLRTRPFVLFEKWRVRESHPAVKAYEAPMGTGPPAMRENGSECVGTELNRQSLKAGELRPLELANAQPTQMNQVTRVGVEPTDHEGFGHRRCLPIGRCRWSTPLCRIAYRAVMSRSVPEGI